MAQGEHEHRLGSRAVGGIRGASTGTLAITKNALYGGAAGLLLGGTLTLVVDSEHRDDTLRWGVVIGVFRGFLYGIYDSGRDAEGFSLESRRDGWSGSAAHRTRNRFGALSTDSAILGSRVGPASLKVDSPAAGRTLGRPSGGGSWGPKVPSSANYVSLSFAGTGGSDAN